MKIQNSARLQDIQEAFTKEFPFLRIEFYEDGHGPGEGSPRGKQLDASLTIGAVRTKGPDGVLKLDPDMAINVFEGMIKRDFNLNVQVFRKSGNLWLQTITTDKWTLDQADKKGGHSSELYREKYGED